MEKRKDKGEASGVGGGRESRGDVGGGPAAVLGPTGPGVRGEALR